MRIDQWQSSYGPWAVVTGASDGIGKAIAKELATRGLNLVLVARRREALETLATGLASRHHIETVVIAADLSQMSGMEQVLDQTADLPIGMLVASAGFGTSGHFISLPLDQEIAMLDVNCRAVLVLAHHFGQRFAERGSGCMILMSSLVAFQGVAMTSHYAATKAYIQSLAEGLQAELGPLGVDVIAAAPGPVHSGFASRANMQMGAALIPEVVAREIVQAVGRNKTVRPGFLTKFLDGSLSFLPRQGRVWAMSRVMRGMTAHQASEPSHSGVS